MSTEAKPKISTVRVVSEELSTFIDRLAEEIVVDDNVPACSMCAIGDCSQQVSGMVCRNAVKAWLLTKAGEYLTQNIRRSSKMEKYFSYLENLRESGATNMFGASPYLQEHFSELRHDRRRAHEILQAWMDSYQQRQGEDQ